MTSQDNQQFVTIELYNSGINRLEQKIIQLGDQMNASFLNVRNEIQAVNTNVLINSARIDDHKDFNGTWFTVLTLVIALFAILTTLAPMFRDMYKDAKQSRNENNLRQFIREEVDLAVNQALNIK